MWSSAFDRRRLLQGFGTTLLLPRFEGLLPRRAPPPPRRLFVLAVPFGMVEEWFHPKATGSDWELPPSLEPLATQRARFTLFSNLDHGVRGGHSATHTLLSGVKSTERATNPEGNLTLDQRVAETVGPATRFPSLVFWDAGTNFTRTGVRVPCLARPSQAFRELFVEASEDEKRFERAGLAASGSVLDAVRAEARRLAERLGTADRAKLDEYLTAVREAETKLAAAGEWLDRPRPRIDEPSAAGLGAGERDEPYGAVLLEAWLELAFLALRSDSTRVLTLAVPGCNWGLPEVSEGYHPITHHGQREERLSQLRAIERFQMTQLARFLARLASAEEADGSTLLDATQVLFGSGMSNGNRHTNSNLPLLLAGGRFRHGQHFDLGNREPLCNLFLTMLHELGIEDERFNRSNGPLSGLEFG
jgi:hypothetical protein